MAGDPQGHLLAAAVGELAGCQWKNERRRSLGRGSLACLRPKRRSACSCRANASGGARRSAPRPPGTPLPSGGPARATNPVRTSLLLFVDAQPEVLSGEVAAGRACAMAIGGTTLAQEPLGHGLAGHHGNNASQRYAPLEQIDRDNFGELEVAWRWSSPDNELMTGDGATGGRRMTPRNHEAIPIKVGDRLYVTTGYGQIAAIDIEQGKSSWTYDPKAYVHGRPTNLGFTHRGAAYWKDPDLPGEGGRLVWAGGDSFLRAVRHAERRTDRVVRRRRRCGPHPRSAPGGVAPGLQREFAGHAVPRRGDRRFFDLGRSARAGGAAGGRARIRRPAPGSSSGPSTPSRRRGNPGAIRGENGSWKGQRQHERMDPDECGPKARPRLPAVRNADQRLVRRAPPRRQPLRRVARRGRLRDR